MNLNFMYAHCCGSVRSYQVAHLTLSHHRSAMGAGHNGHAAADAYSHRTRGRWESLPGRRKPERWTNREVRPGLTEFARPLISTFLSKEAINRCWRTSTTTTQTEGGRVVEMQMRVIPARISSTIRSYPAFRARGSSACTRGTSTRCSLRNQTWSSLGRNTSLRIKSLVPSSPITDARRANVRQ
jgi:hypothetical protein